jgi:UDP-glucose 4-epimerase
MNSVLVTGGAGFIGSAVVPQLLKQNFKVSVVDDLSFGSKEFLDLSQVAFFECDIRDRVKLEEVFRKSQPDYLVHLAAVHFIPYCNEHPFEAADINILGTQGVLDLCRRFKVKRLLFASTAAVYPILDEPIVETSPTGPLDIYGLSKLTGEFLCKQFGELNSTDVVICRFFNAFGPNETNPHLIPAIENQLRNGFREIQLGNLEPKRDFIHTADMASAVVGLLKADIPSGAVFNLGRGIEYSVREVVEAFAKCLGEEIIITQNPDRMRPSDRMHLLADNSKLMEAIGWRAEKSLEEGIKTMVESWSK